MPLRVTKQVHVCGLCGQKGHNVASCTLPGAEEFRRLKRFQRTQTAQNAKDVGRKKNRLGGGRQPEKHSRRATKAYSGAQAVAKKREVRNARRRKVCSGQVSIVQIRLELDDMQQHGLLKKPGRCPRCKRGNLYENQRGSSLHVLYRCSDNDCRFSISALAHGSLFPPNIGRTFNAKQLNEVTKQYAYATSSLNVLAIAKSAGVHHKGVRRLFAWFRAAEAEAGLEANLSARLRGAVEVDASKLRTIKVSRKSVTWADEIKKFQENGGTKSKRCKYYIAHICLLGGFERRSSCSVLEAMTPRILAPSSRPTAESLQDVADSGIMTKLTKNAAPRHGFFWNHLEIFSDFPFV